MSRIGEVSPYLSADWIEAQKLMDNLEGRGLLRGLRTATENYEVGYPNSLRLKRGEKIQLFEKESPEKWRDWKWSKDSAGKEGWISETYFQRDNESRSHDYSGLHRSRDRDTRRRNS